MLPNEIERILNEVLAERPLPLARLPVLSYPAPIAARRPIKFGKTHCTRPCPKLLDGSCPLLNGELGCGKRQMRGCAFKVLGGGREIDLARAGRLLAHPQSQLALWKHYAVIHPKGVKCFNELGIPNDPLGVTRYG